MGLSTEAQKQVREAAITVLKGANMEDMTERKLRTALEKQLGLELGGEEEKNFLRGVIGEFLDRDEVTSNSDILTGSARGRNALRYGTDKD